MSRNLKILQKTITTFAIIIILLGFTETANMVTGNWYQQFMPNIGGRTISDITFLDSLTGFATAYSSSDTNFILKTTDSGNNWNIIYRNFALSNRVQFLNPNTGYVCGGLLIKTTNGGLNWFNVNTSGIAPENMFVLNQDTIWLVDNNGLVGGVFRTTNSGVNWVQQYGSNQNPSHIYMYNARIGFMDGGGLLRRTTDGGFNWTPITGEGSFTQIFFIDSLTGWKCLDSIKKTTDGGQNWIRQIIPSGGVILTPSTTSFSVINKDTIWANGGQAFFGSGQFRGILLRTTNGGNNWLFQIPDTSIHIPGYGKIQFINKNTGWAYGVSTGVHTTTGGDPIWLTGIKQVSNNVPKEFELKQNYPNPFNPRTVIPYSIKKSAYVKLILYDITGKEIISLVDQKQTAGTYEVDFSGSGFSSGVYFYSLFIDNILTVTKKMILLK